MTTQTEVNLTEAQAISKAKDGDADAFEYLYKAYCRRVYGVCLRMIKNPGEAEDLTQQAFLQLFRKIGTFRGESSFSTWLHRVTVNIVLMYLRRKKPDEILAVDLATGQMRPNGYVLTGGAGPISVTVDPTGQFAYVVNFGSDNISAFSVNPNTGTLTAVGPAVATGNRPRSVAVDPSGKFAYVANLDSNNVSAFAINTNTGALTAVGSPVAAGTTPFSVTVDPLGKFAYVANLGSNNVSEFTIDPRTGALTAVGVPVTSGASPSSLAVEPTGRFAYVTNRTQRNLPILEPLSAVSRMVAFISHDLRQPLTAILANAEFLTRSEMNETQRNDSYQEIRWAIDQMNELVSSLLECSKGRDTLRPATRNIVDTVERAIRMASVRQEFRRITIKHHHKGLAVGWFDSNRLERVVANLVLNACEAVCPDSGRIFVTTTGNRDCLQIGVWDNGPGIPPTIQDSVFQPFVTYGKIEGGGLGLAIAKKIVEDHGGDIYLDRSNATGTLFKITIPFAIPEGTIE
jgi:RNA polymerase sigma factor (sigma-70 family)